MRSQRQVRERQEIARRRTEEERAEAIFPLRVTTTAADSPRDCASEQAKLDRSESHVPGVLLTQIDVGDLVHRYQYLASTLVGEREHLVTAVCD
jgi:isopentenyldiphosphate isomerase